MFFINSSITTLSMIAVKLTRPMSFLLIIYVKILTTPPTNFLHWKSAFLYESHLGTLPKLESSELRSFTVLKSWTEDTSNINVHIA